MKSKILLSLSAIGVVTLAGCATGSSMPQGSSQASMPMAMMGDKGMMEQCIAHMSKMSPEMKQKHMEMMKKHHQMMEPKSKS